MSFEVKILSDSISPAGVRATTFEIRYPRFIHSEFMTHRVFERNAASSRAIPIKKMLKSVMTDMAKPIYWGKNKSGMQAAEELSGIRLFLAKLLWKWAGLSACAFSFALYKVGAHKQIANRITEPFSHIKVVVTAVYWENFFDLRAHPDAQPEFQHLAVMMSKEREKSTPRLLKPGQWHLPYVEMDDYGSYYIADDDYSGLSRSLTLQDAIDFSAAMCASVSYKTVDGLPMTLEKAHEIKVKLLSSFPLHASPAGHQLTPDHHRKYKSGKIKWKAPELHGPMFGYIQYRKTLQGEATDEYAHMK